MKLFGAIEFFSGALDSREAVAYTLSATALKQLKAEGMPAEGVQALRVLKGQRLETESAFLQAVEKQLGAEALGQYRALLLKLGEGRASSTQPPMRRSCANCWRESPCRLS